MRAFPIVKSKDPIDNLTRLLATWFSNPENRPRLVTIINDVLERHSQRLTQTMIQSAKSYLPDAIGARLPIDRVEQIKGSFPNISPETVFDAFEFIMKQGNWRASGHTAGAGSASLNTEIMLEIINSFKAMTVFLLSRNDIDSKLRQRLAEFVGDQLLSNSPVDFAEKAEVIFNATWALIKPTVTTSESSSALDDDDDFQEGAHQNSSAPQRTADSEPQFYDQMRMDPASFQQSSPNQAGFFPAQPVNSPASSQENLSRAPSRQSAENADDDHASNDDENEVSSAAERSPSR